MGVGRSYCRSRSRLLGGVFGKSSLPLARVEGDFAVAATVGAVKEDVAVEMLTASVDAGSFAAAGVPALNLASAAPRRFCSVMVFVG